MWADGRVRTNAALFYIDWTDLQLNLPIPGGGGAVLHFECGGATSRGVEVEITARATDGVDLFGGFGLTRARFSGGSTSKWRGRLGQAGALHPGLHRLVRRPAFAHRPPDTWSSAVRKWFARLVQVRRCERRGAGCLHIGERCAPVLRSARCRWTAGSGTRSIPVTFRPRSSYPGLAPSGFVAERGAPRTFGVSIGIRF